MTSNMSESYGIKWSDAEYPAGTASSVPVVEMDISTEMPVEYQLTALRGLDRRRALNEKYDADLNILKKEAFRAAVQETVAQEQARAEDGSTRSGALFFVDLGNFKKANGPNGSTQEIGDDVLKIVTNRFRRGSDLVGRLGGDEIAIFAWLDNRTDTDKTPADMLNEEYDRIESARDEVVEKYSFLGSGKVQFFVGVGGTIYDPNLSYAMNEQVANIEMGTAKEKGYDQYGKYRVADAA